VEAHFSGVRPWAHADDFVRGRMAKVKQNKQKNKKKKQIFGFISGNHFYLTSKLLFNSLRLSAQNVMR
jgi:hypothetical protein